MNADLDLSGGDISIETVPYECQRSSGASVVFENRSFVFSPTGTAASTFDVTARRPAVPDGRTGDTGTW